jgi:hypothetical protein
MEHQACDGSVVMALLVGYGTVPVTSHKYRGEVHRRHELIRYLMERLYYRGSKSALQYRADLESTRTNGIIVPGVKEPNQVFVA